MNLKQEYFVVHYVKNGADIESASNQVGITPNTAKRWLKRDDVRDYIAELNKDIEKTLKINKTRIVSEYWEMAQEAKKDLSDTGSLAKGCLDSLSKLMGYDAPIKVEHSMDLSKWLTSEEVIDVKVN